MLLQGEQYRCSRNEGVFSVDGDRGSLTVTRHKGNQHKGDQDLAIDFRATIAGISALIYGTCAIDDLIHKQGITDLNPAIYALLETSFTPCVIYNPFKF